MKAFCFAGVGVRVGSMHVRLHAGTGCVDTGDVGMRVVRCKFVSVRELATCPKQCQSGKNIRPAPHAQQVTQSGYWQIQHLQAPIFHCVVCQLMPLARCSART